MHANVHRSSTPAPLPACKPPILPLILVGPGGSLLLSTRRLQLRSPQCRKLFFNNPAASLPPLPILHRTCNTTTFLPRAVTQPFVGSSDVLLASRYTSGLEAVLPLLRLRVAILVQQLLN